MRRRLGRQIQREGISRSPSRCNLHLKMEQICHSYRKSNACHWLSVQQSLILHHFHDHGIVEIHLAPSLESTGFLEGSILFIFAPFTFSLTSIFSFCWAFFREHVVAALFSRVTHIPRETTITNAMEAHAQLEIQSLK